jgi:HEAT repeat protein
MLTYYCPNCWSTVTEEDIICPKCNFELGVFQQLEYEEKLLTALYHSVPERRIMAAQILGNIQSERALNEFQKIIESGETDYFFMRAILIAIAKIDSSCKLYLLNLATLNESILVKRLAHRLIDIVSKNSEIDEWDHYTG